ncbi:MAG: alpha/beta hydrolase, partial [Prevotellaceae bacterium]|nr:alpha/beta hydrolase [Prevotellaceae bacterium]
MADSVAYACQEISIPLGDGDVCLSGTMTIPEHTGKETKVAILVSPPQVEKRDYFGVFSSLSDELSRNGVAVLRFDNRTFDPATTSMHTHAKDVESVVAFVRKQEEFRNARIGLVGHSEGGCVAMIVAARSSDVNFLIFLSTVGINGKEHSLRAMKEGIKHFLALASSTKILVPSTKIANRDKIANRVVHAYSIYADIVNQESDTSIIKQRMKDEYLRQEYEQDKPRISFEEYCQQIYKQDLQPWTMAMFRFKPNDYLPKIQVPVLAVCGSRDWKVPAKDNLKGLKKGLAKGGNKQVKTVIIKDMNHDYEIVDKSHDYDAHTPHSLTPQKPKKLNIAPGVWPIM